MEMGTLIFDIDGTICYNIGKPGEYENSIPRHEVIREINKKYDFKKIPSFDMENRYDNEVFYDSISPRDYLTYQLIYIRKDVISAILANHQRLQRKKRLSISSSSSGTENHLR